MKKMIDGSKIFLKVVYIIPLLIWLFPAVIYLLPLLWAEGGMDSIKDFFNDIKSMV